MKRLVALLFVTIAVSGSHSIAKATDTKALQAIADGEHRSEANRARNTSRNPVETLAFFGIKKDMTVIEITPGGGWYTEILAPFLKDEGQYIAAGFNPASEVKYYAKNAKKFAEKLASKPDLYSKTVVSIVEPPKQVDYAKPNSADMIVTFRNTHSWIRRDNAKVMFDSFYKILKKGGVLGIVQHRADKDQNTNNGNSGYVTEAEVKALAKAAGLKFVASSEVNANPKDTKNYEKGVWTLPPSYALKDKNKAQYAAIGESDRMTLKFIKP